MKRTFYLIKIKQSPYWQIIYYKNGKRTIKSTGTKLKSEALSYLTKFKEKLEERKLTQMTLSEFESEYINHISLTHSKSYVEKSVRLAFKMFSKHVDKSILHFKSIIKLKITILIEFVQYRINNSSPSNISISLVPSL